MQVMDCCPASCAQADGFEAAGPSGVAPCPPYLPACPSAHRRGTPSRAGWPLPWAQTSVALQRCPPPARAPSRGPRPPGGGWHLAAAGSRAGDGAGYGRRGQVTCGGARSAALRAWALRPLRSAWPAAPAGQPAGVPSLVGPRPWWPGCSAAAHGPSSHGARSGACLLLGVGCQRADAPLLQVRLAQRLLLVGGAPAQHHQRPAPLEALLLAALLVFVAESLFIAAAARQAAGRRAASAALILLIAAAEGLVLVLAAACVWARKAAASGQVFRRGS